MSYVSTPFAPTAFAPAKLTRRALAKQRTRERVLLAARHLFSERGYEGATIRDIAQSAGMSTGAVFASFADKAELFAAILAADHQALFTQMIGASRNAAMTEEALLGLFGVAYRFHLEQLPLLRASIAVSWTQSDADQAQSRDATLSIVGLLAEVCQTGVERGELRPDLDANLLAEMAWDLYLANYRRAMFDQWSAESLLARLSDQLKVIFTGARA